MTHPKAVRDYGSVDELAKKSNTSFANTNTPKPMENRKNGSTHTSDTEKNSPHSKTSSNGTTKQESTKAWISEPQKKYSGKD